VIVGVGVFVGVSVDVIVGVGVGVGVFVVTGVTVGVIVGVGVTVGVIVGVGVGVGDNNRLQLTILNFSQSCETIRKPIAGAVLNNGGKYIVSAGGTPSKIVATKIH
jgi:hypothetical protein